MSTTVKPNHECKYCEIKFYEKIYSTKSLYGYKTGVCQNCKTLYNNLHNGTMKIEDMYPGYLIKIKYEVTKEDHDGYCSDPYDETVKKSVLTVKFQMPKFLTKYDFDENNNMISGFKYFEKDPDDHGNGYCHMKTRYYIKSGKLMRENNLHSKRLFE